MRIFLNNNSVSFKRYFKNENEKIKQYELNRNKSLEYVLEKKDLDFVDFVSSERKKENFENINSEIAQKLGENFSLKKSKYNSFHYPQVVRGIRNNELKRLKNGEQIYSNQRRHSFGVDVTNYPEGLGYGYYLVKFKLKPNLDNFISDCYAYEFEKENMPHLEICSKGSGLLDHHSILNGTYTINDVEQIIELDTKKVIYNQSEEQIPKYNDLLIKVFSENENEIIDAVEKLQTYYGDGRFMKDISFLLNSKNSKIQEAYINAFYNYGKKENLNEIINFLEEREIIDNAVVARIANCIEKFGEKNKCNEIIKKLVKKVSQNPSDENTMYAYKNIFDAMKSTNFNNNKEAIKHYILQEKSIPLKAIAIKTILPFDNSVSAEINNHINRLIEEYEFNLNDYNDDKIYTEEEIFLKEAINFYKQISFIKR